MARKFYVIMRAQKDVETEYGIAKVVEGQRILPVFESREAAEEAAKNFEEIIEMEELDPRIYVLDDMVKEAQEALENIEKGKETK